VRALALLLVRPGAQGRTPLRSFLAAAIGALVTASLASAAGPAEGGGGDREIRRSGSCSGPSDWKLKLKFDDGRIEAEFEVDQNRVGQRWSVTLRDNGRIVFRGLRTTRAPSGSFELERRIANRRGLDRVVATARHARSGERCRGTARI
jgi:hypothetical protein